MLPTAPEHSFHGVLFGWPFIGHLHLQRLQILRRADLALPSTYFQFNRFFLRAMIFSILIGFLFRYIHYYDGPFAPWKRQVLPAWAQQLSLNVFHGVPCVQWSASVSERNEMPWWGPQPQTWMWQACGAVKDSKTRHDKLGNKLNMSAYESPMKSLYIFKW